MIDKNIIFLSYGNELEYKRTVFSLLSFFSWYDSDLSHIRVIIYTDNHKYFKTFLSGFNIEYVDLTKDLLASMLDGTGFLHRIKVSVIDLTFKNFPGEHVVFFDSDTFFIRDSSKLINVFLPGKSFMHLREYKLSEGINVFNAFNQAQYPKAFNSYIKDREFFILDKPVTFTLDDYSWNSGVLGMHCEFSKYMESVMRLTDQFYANSEWFISEQLAFSLVLQRTTEISACNDVVLHYWGQRQKDLMDRSITTLLAEYSIEEINDKKLIRKQTKKWLKMIAVDIILQQAAISISNASYYYAFKKIAQLVMKSPQSILLLPKELQRDSNKN